MTPIEQAILRTVIYADIFSFALAPSEIHHFLITDNPTTLAQVEEALATSAGLREALETGEGYIACAGRGALIALRAERERAAAALLPNARICGAWLARLPFVRMVALTGALAMHNAPHEDDDLDYVLVTAPRRVWLARAFAILLVRYGKRRGVVICPNYVLAESALEQDQHDLFMAHEIAQMIPLYGMPLYERMREVNAWVGDHLANATAPYYAEVETPPTPFWNALKQFAEFALGGRIGDALEQWEYRRKLRRFSKDMQTPNHAARLDDEHVKGHFNDHGHPVMAKYHHRLQALDLDPHTVGSVSAAVREP